MTLRLVHLFKKYFSSPDGIPVCCQYFYIDGNFCKECPAGYRVLSSDYNCTDPCDYPSYGAHCRETCSCSNEDCHHVYGCPETSTIRKTTTYTFLETEGFSRGKNVDLR